MASKVPVIILLDIGNTQFKWATLSEDVFTFMNSTPYQPDTIADDLSNVLSDFPRCQHLVIANVAPSHVATKLIEWAMQHSEYQIEWIKAEACRGDLINAYTEPQLLGIDRWAAMVAARQQYSEEAVIIFNIGTCLTVDIIASSGKHRGGYILPGLQLMRSILMNTSLSERCDPSEMNKEASRQLGQDTYSAIYYGSFQMFSAFIEQTVQQTQLELLDSVTPILTGGGASELLTVLQGSYVYKPHLVLQGLAIMASN